MSTAIMAPERQILPSNEGKSKGNASRTALRFRELACIFILFLTDGLAFGAALVLAVLLRAHLIPHMRSGGAPFSFHAGHSAAIAGLWLSLAAILGADGLYTQRRSFWSESSHLTKAVGLALTAVLAAVALIQPASPSLRPVILLTALNLVFLLPIARYWTKLSLCALGLWRKRILVLGTDSAAMLAMEGLTSDPVLGYEVAGRFDNDPAKRGKRPGDSDGEPLFVSGDLFESREQMQRTQVKDVLIAMPDMPEGNLHALVHALHPCCDSIYIVSQLWALPMMNLKVEGLLPERMMMLKLSNNLAQPWNHWLKRGIDLLLGAMIGFLVAPLCLLLAALIKLDSAGPALFVQERIGYRGGVFRCLKFRTMILNGEEKLAAHLAGNPQAADEWRKYAKLRNCDPRLTRLGRFLRRWSLDELPQLWNILKGEMSLVGPRPYIPQERGRMGDQFSTILSVRPGLTGYWQVNGRNDVTLEDRVQLEAWYVRNWTAWLDCIVLAKTFKVVLFPDNRHRAADRPAQVSAAGEPAAGPLAYRHHA